MKLKTLKIPSPSWMKARRIAQVPFFMKLSLVSDSLSHLSYEALLEFRKIGEGVLADQFWPIAKALKEDGYDSVVSYESVYPPEGGTFENAFHAAIGCLKTIFGECDALCYSREPLQSLASGNSVDVSL